MEGILDWKPWCEFVWFFRGGKTKKAVEGVSTLQLGVISVCFSMFFVWTNVKKMDELKHWLCVF